MKTTLSIMLNKKYEITKLTFVFLLTILYPRIHNLLRNILSNTFGNVNLLYVNRTLFIILIIVLIVLTSSRFSVFSKRYDENLILLGMNTFQRFTLFFSKNYEILFLQLYFGTMNYQIEHISILISFPANLISAVFVYMAGILIALKIHSKSFLFFVATLICTLGALIGSNKLTYNVVYKLLMSEGTKQILFSDSAFPFLTRFAITMFLLFIATNIYNHSDAGLSHDSSHSHHLNFFGDFIHKMSCHPVYSKNYFGMYRNRDYLLWKLFSSILLLIVCYTCNHSLVLFLTSYGICLITSFYYKDIYNLERNLLFVYVMSNYSYKNLMVDCIIGGLYILGDNIFVILLIWCMSIRGNFLLLLSIGVAVIFISLFLSSSLYEKYPAKQYYYNILLILIKLHLPILNVFILYKNFKKGQKNWENLIYERMQ